jgi:hypothetical protein
MDDVAQPAADRNSELAFHPLADLFPLMEGAEFDALVADIKANALRFKIILHEGKILDGRNRYRAMLAAGHTPSKGHFQKYKPILPSDTPLSYVIRTNLHRRHLTAEQKRDVIAKLIKAQPEKSDRQIAKEARADHKTVGAVRRAKEATGEISPVDKRVGADGKARKQPKKRKRGKPLAPPILSPEEKRERDREWAEFKANPEADGDDDTRIEEIEKAAEATAHRLIERAPDLAREIHEFTDEHWWPFVEALRREFRSSRKQESCGNDSEASAMSAVTDNNDPGPIPECLRRAP